MAFSDTNWYWCYHFNLLTHPLEILSRNVIGDVMNCIIAVWIQQVEQTVANCQTPILKNIFVLSLPSMATKSTNICGMGKNDDDALTVEQQSKLNAFKVGLVRIHF